MKLKTLNLHLTNRCNMRCRHCLYSSGEENIDEMDYKEIKKLIEEFAIISGNKGTINMFGGEVFLRGDAFRIIDLALSKKLNVGITTNVNFPKEVINRICRTEVSRLTVDVDGASALSHEWLRRQPGHFKKSLESIKLFIQAGKFTTINIVLHKKNANEVERMLNLCQRAGVNFVSFYLFTQLGRGNAIKDLVIGPEEWKALRKRVKRWLDDNKPNFGVIWERSYEDTNKIVYLSPALCQGKPSDVIDVRCDGNVYYCGLLSAVDSLSLGNIRKKTLSSVLNQRKKCASSIKLGCPALAFGQNLHKSVDPRLSTKKIVPVCPYDWELLHGSLPDLRRKFAHVDS